MATRDDQRAEALGLVEVVGGPAAQSIDSEGGVGAEGAPEEGLDPRETRVFVEGVTEREHEVEELADVLLGDEAVGGGSSMAVGDDVPQVSSR